MGKCLTSIQHLSDIDRLNNPSNGDTLVWNALNNQYEYSQAVVSAGITCYYR